MIYIIIPNLNGMEHLETCFRSLQNQSCGDFKIILVDNGSTDGSVNLISEYFSKSKIINLDINMGFAKAVNIGIKFAISNPDCKKILLLNNDTECDKHMIEEMLLSFQNANVGSVGCKMMNFYERDKFDEAGHFIDKRGFPHKRGYGEVDIGQYNKSEFIFGACAGATMYKREVFEIVGLFDEDFFAYYEDVDLNMRMQVFGYKCFYNPKAICFHKIGATSSNYSGLKLYLMEKNLTSLIVKNFPVSIFPKYFLSSNIFRLRGFASLFLRGQFNDLKFSLKGYFTGLIEIPKSLGKRSDILRNIKVSSSYLESFGNKEKLSNLY